MALVITDQQPLLRIKKAGHFRTFHIFTSCENTKSKHVWWERRPGKFLVFFGRAAFSPPQVKMLRPGQKRMRKHSGCPAEIIYLFFFKLTIYKHCSEKEKKKDFCWSIIIGIFNEWCQQNPSRDALLHKYCVAVWKEESGAVGGEARRARAGERILIWAARSLLKKLILKEAQRKYPFTENVTGERRSSCEPVQCFARRESAVCKQQVLQGRTANEVNRGGGMSL